MTKPNFETCGKVRRRKSEASENLQNSYRIEPPAAIQIFCPDHF